MNSRAKVNFFVKINLLKYSFHFIFLSQVFKYLFGVGIAVKYDFFYIWHLTFLILHYRIC
jgi:hypothetical protein